MEVKSQEFHKASQKALGNQKLRRALINVTNRFQEARTTAFSELDGEGLREAGRRIKEHTINCLDQYLELAEKAITEKGGKVHWARTPEEACKIILQIAEAGGVKRVVKSKSMISEEIGINEVLEEAKIDVVETDLGEYIIQLAKEKPSHIIIPAIHKTKEDVSKLFLEHLKEKLVTIPEMTEVARRTLRDRFFSAEMGITGGNYLVAETGTLVIVENEGNARFTMTLPRIHVAVVGIEKLVPRLEDLTVMLPLLTRSATGQKITSYVSLLNGPVEGKEFHLVFLDNGRTKIMKDPDLRESLYCIRCGACMNVCPVYQKVGGHAYGWVYPGPIGSIVTPLLVGLQKADQLPYASSLCGACGDVCPVKIPIPHILVRLRQRITDGQKSNRMQRLGFQLWTFVMKDKGRYEIFTWLAAKFQKFFNRSLLARSWGKHREMPRVSHERFRDWWRKKR